MSGCKDIWHVISVKELFDPYMDFDPQVENHCLKASVWLKYKVFLKKKYDDW